MSTDFNPADLNLDFEALKTQVFGQPEETLDFNLAVKAFRVASQRVEEAEQVWDEARTAVKVAEENLREQKHFARAILVHMSEAIGVDLANIKD